jgi:hypothetical protein
MSSGARRIFALVIAVRDLDAALESYAALGFGVKHRAPRSEWGIDAAVLDIEDAMLELIAPVDETKPVAQ